MIAKVCSELIGLLVESILHHKHHSRFRRVLAILPSKRRVPSVLFSHGHNNGRIVQGDYFPTDHYRDRRVFLLVRDPRDIVVSHYCYSKWQLNTFDGSVSEFIRYPFAQADWKSKQARFGIQPVLNYLNAWIENSTTFSDFYVAFYEDFKLDTEKQLRLLCNYVGLDACDGLLREAVSFGSFDNMRRMELSDSLKWNGLQGS